MNRAMDLTSSNESSGGVPDRTHANELLIACHTAAAIAVMWLGAPQGGWGGGYLDCGDVTSLEVRKLVDNLPRKVEHF